MRSPPVTFDSQDAAHRARFRPHPALAIAAFFLLLHAFLAATVDASRPDVFLRADRALERIHVIEEFLVAQSGGELIPFLSSHGVIGDYAVHAVLYGLGGQFAVVAVQILLTVLSGAAVYGIGAMLGLTPRWRGLAMAVYLLLPHNIVFPHQLVTEALHVPLFVISTWLLAAGLQRDRPRARVGSALCLGFATLIRPITLLWPIAAGLAVAVGRRPRDGVAYGLMAMLPVLVWMTFMASQTGRFGLGESGHSMETNLYNRVLRITATLPPAERDAARAKHLDPQTRALGPVDYFSFAADHPLATAKHVGRDAVAFFVKSGIERVTLDYAGNPNTKAVQNPSDGWRQQLELHGPVHTAAYLWRQLGFVLVLSVVGAAAMTVLMVCALAGAIRFMRRWRDVHQPDVLIGILLTALIGYFFVFSQVLNAMQSRQRAPAEFAVVLLAAAGLALRRKRVAR